MKTLIQDKLRGLLDQCVIIYMLDQCGPRLRAWRAALRFEKASRAAKIKSRSGWSNFSTLVGHIFEKLYEFARLNRIKTLIFVSKSGCSPKKKEGSLLGIGLQNSYFSAKS